MQSTLPPSIGQGTLSLADSFFSGQVLGRQSAVGLGFWTFMGIVFPTPCRSCSRLVSLPLLGNLCKECWAGVKPLSIPQCERCALPLDPLRGKRPCPDCSRLKPVFEKAAAVSSFQGLWREAIHDFKFRSKTLLKRPFGQLLAHCYQQAVWPAGHAAVVSVPLGPETWRERGYDQNAEMARVFCRVQNLDWLKGALKKQKGVEKQSKLGREARLRNLDGAFLAKLPTSFKGKRLLLLDDIFTTGATAQACTRQLLQAGAQAVDVLVLARSVEECYS